MNSRYSLYYKKANDSVDVVFDNGTRMTLIRRVSMDFIFSQKNLSVYDYPIISLINVPYPCLSVKSVLSVFYFLMAESLLKYV